MKKIVCGTTMSMQVSVYFYSGKLHKLQEKFELNDEFVHAITDIFFFFYIFWFCSDFEPPLKCCVITIVILEITLLCFSHSYLSIPLSTHNVHRKLKRSSGTQNRSRSPSRSHGSCCFIVLIKNDIFSILVMLHLL